MVSSTTASTTTETAPPNDRAGFVTTEKAWASPEYMHRAAWKAGVMGSLNVLAIVLGVRLTLLVAVGGAISLTWFALQTPDPYRLGALAVYAAVVVLPLVWLAGRR